MTKKGKGEEKYREGKIYIAVNGRFQVSFDRICAIFQVHFQIPRFCVLYLRVDSPVKRAFVYGPRSSATTACCCAPCSMKFYTKGKEPKKKLTKKTKALSRALSLKKSVLSPSGKSQHVSFWFRIFQCLPAHIFVRS